MKRFLSAALAALCLLGAAALAQTAPPFNQYSKNSIDPVMLFVPNPNGAGFIPFSTAFPFQSNVQCTNAATTATSGTTNPVSADVHCVLRVLLVGPDGSTLDVTAPQTIHRKV